MPAGFGSGPYGSGAYGSGPSGLNPYGGLVLNLSALAAVAGSLAGDACTVRRNPGGVHDDVLDRATGTLTPQAAGTVYGPGGPCIVGRVVGDAGSDTAAEDAANPADYRLKLPLAELDGYPEREPRVGDEVTIDSSVNDPGLPGKVFVVSAVRTGSYQPIRVCEMRGQ